MNSSFSDLNIDFVAVFNFVGAITGYFFSLILLGIKGKKSIASKYLALLIFSYSTFLVGSILYQTNYHLVHTYLIGIFPPFYFLIGPFLYLYMLSLVYKEFSFKKIYLLHFVPFILQILFNVPIYLKSSEEKFDFYLKGLIDGPDLFRVLIICARIIYLFVYLILTARLLRTHQVQIENSYSRLEGRRLRWIRTLMIGLMIDAVLYAITIVSRISDSNGFYSLVDISNITAPCIILYMCYKGLTQPDLHVENMLGAVKNRYHYSRLDSDKSEEFLEHILNFMEESKSYLNNEFTIKQLSEETAIPSRYISQVINERLDRNFYEFINDYRIDEVKKRFLDPHYQGSTILDIAFDSGFNTKSTFNAAFKKREGITPSTYRKNLKKYLV